MGIFEDARRVEAELNGKKPVMGIGPNVHSAAQESAIVAAELNGYVPVMRVPGHWRPELQQASGFMLRPTYIDPDEHDVSNESD